jgi:hypothetical protein
MVVLEGPAELSSDRGGQRKTQQTEPALSRASQKPPPSSGGRSSSGTREGNHQRFFPTTVATGLAATRDSSGRGDRRTSASVRAHAGALWSESGNANGAGAARYNGNGGSEPTLVEISQTY